MDSERTCSCGDEWHYHHDHCANKIQSHEEQLAAKDAEIKRLREIIAEQLHNSLLLKEKMVECNRKLDALLETN